MIIKNTMPSAQAAATQSEASFHPTTTIFTRFHNQNASTRSNKFACKNVRKITITYSASGFRKSVENLNNSSPV